MDLDNLNIRKKEPVTNMSGTPGQMTKDLEQELYSGVSNFIGNDDINIKYQKGMFSVVEYRKDLSVTPGEAQLQYFMSKMNIKKKQLVIKIDENHSVILQAGAMQWMLGSHTNKPFPTYSGLTALSPVTLPLTILPRRSPAPLIPVVVLTLPSIHCIAPACNITE